MIRWTKPHTSRSSYVGIKSCANKGEPWWQRQSMSRYDVYLRKTSSLSNKNVYHVLIIIMQNLWLLARLKPGNHFSSLCENLPWSQQARLFSLVLIYCFLSRNSEQLSPKMFGTCVSVNICDNNVQSVTKWKLWSCLLVCLFVCLFAYTTKLLLIDDLVLSGLGILEKKAKFSKMRVTLMAV